MCLITVGVGCVMLGVAGWRMVRVDLSPKCVAGNWPHCVAHGVSQACGSSETCVHQVTLFLNSSVYCVLLYIHHVAAGKV